MEVVATTVHPHYKRYTYYPGRSFIIGGSVNTSDHFITYTYVKALDFIDSLCVEDRGILCTFSVRRTVRS